MTDFVYPIYLDLPNQFLANKVKKQLTENFAREYGHQFLGKDKNGLLWFGFDSWEEREEFRIEMRYLLVGTLGLMIEDTDAPSSALQLTYKGPVLTLA